MPTVVSTADPVRMGLDRVDRGCNSVCALADIVATGVAEVTMQVGTRAGSPWAINDDCTDTANP
jgi:hypothetical protein